MEVNDGTENPGLLPPQERSSHSGATGLPAGPPLVGIGASAGGLKALEEFFATMPPDTRMAFVVIMHLDPEHQSSLPEIIQARTPMRVVQVNATTPVEPNHIYIIPPDRQLRVADHKLSVSAFDEPRGQRLPIDSFFRSLAAVDGDCYAVVLSGGGTDGSVGVKMVKESGGLLLAQAPAEAEFDSMPRAAIATGLMDVVLPVRGLAEHLAHLARHEPHIRPDTGGPGEERDLVQRIFAQVRARTGHDFTQYKRSTALRRIARRMQVNKVGRLAEYLDLLRENANEAHALYRDMLIGVTSFFRDPDAWNALREEVLPKLFAGKTGDDAIRAWSCGCSTGEEAYSLAMLMCEYASTLDERPHIQVFASDIDEESLARAREGLYPKAIAADLSEERLARFFTEEGNYYRTKQEIRDLVLFATHNVLRDPPFSRIDLISCRNLLIYLDRELQDFTLDVFHYALRPKGYLFLGGSETVGDPTRYWTLNKTHRIHQCRERAGEPPRLPLMPSGRELPPPLRSTRRATTREDASEAALHRSILEEHSPPSMLVDAGHSVVHLSETAGQYLQPSGGTLTSDAIKLVRPELRAELRRALAAAFDEGRSTVTRPMPIAFGQTAAPVSMMVRPRAQRDGHERLALVLFIEGDADTLYAAAEPGGTDYPSRQRESEFQRLREQYQALVEDHEAANEELRAANEELQSINEEYRSTTEELETSKEELQSVNEELHTVNHELKNKLDEISQAHNDLQNLMASTEIGTLFLDRELRIKRYTPRMRDFFNIMPTDVGRPLEHLAHTFDYGGAVEDAHRVLSNLVPVDREVRANDGRFYLMRLRPYRTFEDRIEGVVVTFVDISERKVAEEALRQSEERFRLVVDNARDFAIFTVDEENRIETWNTGGGRVLGWSEAEILGKRSDIIFTPEDRAAGEPEKELNRAREEGRSEDLRWHVRRDGTRFWGSGIMFRLYDPGGEGRGYAKILRDMTHQKQAEEEMKALNESLERRVEERTAELNEKSGQIRRLASELVIAEQRERHRIAQVLHDDLQQLLFGVRMKAQLLQDRAAQDHGAHLQEGIAELGTHLTTAIEQARRLSVDLSPPVLQDEGLTHALRWLERQMHDLYGLSLSVDAAGAFRIRSHEMRVLLFQVARELIFNVVKHADTDRAMVQLRPSGSLLLMRIKDKGRGFDPRAENKKGDEQSGLGLRSIRERLDLFGGRMRVESRPGGGTVVEVTVPVEWDTAFGHTGGEEQ